VNTDQIEEQVTSVCERAKHELLALVHLMPSGMAEPSKPAQEWMTAGQLADYWQLYNKDGEPTTAGIMKWAKRSPDKFPLPHAYMGDLMRFHRHEVDQWAKEEAHRRRTENERKRLKLAG
jgi:hypothetical protein